MEYWWKMIISRRKELKLPQLKTQCREYSNEGFQS
jgi:hypothetical protein